MPFLVDGDFSMNECRAIATYLVRRYGGGEGDDHPLYPSDARLRARVDQRLSFDGSEFYKAFMDVTVREREREREGGGCVVQHDIKKKNTSFQ